MNGHEQYSKLILNENHGDFLLKLEIVPFYKYSAPFLTVLNSKTFLIIDYFKMWKLGSTDYVFFQP